MFPELADKEVSLLVWTTTPWTLPLNRAVLLKPDTEYVALDVDGTYIVTAQQLAEKVSTLKNVPTTKIASFNTASIASGILKAHHPFITDFQVPIIFDNSVLLEDGTAVVHSAPGCGPEDYQVGIKNHLEIFSPITPDGKYTADIKPQELTGMPITEGQWWVLRKLMNLVSCFTKQTLFTHIPIVGVVTAD